MAAVRFIPPGKWTRKAKPKYFAARDKAKADRLEKLWKAKSKRNDAAILSGGQRGSMSTLWRGWCNAAAIGTNRELSGNGST